MVQMFTFYYLVPGTNVTADVVAMSTLEQTSLDRGRLFNLFQNFFLNATGFEFDNIRIDTHVCKLHDGRPLGGCVTSTYMFN